MPRKSAVSFANLICRFGERFVLLDLANEIVVPAFLDPSMSRRYATTRYFFLDVKIAKTRDQGDAPVVYVYGRLVKDTVLTREQTYSLDSGLIANPGAMPSAPSSFFTLILNNHKLMYLPETTDAPSLSAFQATLQSFLTIKHREYIEFLYLQYDSTPEPRSKQQLYIEIPHPTVDVMPLASEASIEEFLKAFAKITHLEFKLIDTNDEFQMRGTYEQLREMKRSIRAKSTKLVYDSLAGLDEQSAIQQIHAAAATGNQEVKLAGKSQEGVDLRGNNNDFKLSISAEGLPENDLARAARLVKIYGEQAERGIITEDAGINTDQKISRLRIGDIDAA